MAIWRPENPIGRPMVRHSTNMAALLTVGRRSIKSRVGVAGGCGNPILYREISWMRTENFVRRRSSRSGSGTLPAIAKS